MVQYRWPSTRKHDGTGTSRQRHDHVRVPSGNTAIESLDPGAEPTLRDQSEDGAEVAPAQLRRGRPDGTQAAALDGAVTGGGSADRRLSQAHTAAAGRLPLCARSEERRVGKE